ncbi:MAG TPA: DUF177 domain-containing protein [Stellaceae bacterium]|nr:DUF177 domain-containing protein [Stellaceae bacterium]
MAKRFALLALDRLEAKVRVTPMPGGFYRLAADFKADLAQPCAVTSEPVPAHIEESFTLTYGPAEEETEIVLDGEAEPIEPLDDGMIDMGEAVAQQLSLSLDPFPRAPGASLEEEADLSDPRPRESPFAALAKLRKPGQA